MNKELRRAETKRDLKAGQGAQWDANPKKWTVIALEKAELIKKSGIFSAFFDILESTLNVI